MPDNAQVGPILDISDEVLMVFAFIQGSAWKQDKVTTQILDRLLETDPGPDAGFRKKCDAGLSAQGMQGMPSLESIDKSENAGYLGMRKIAD